MKIFRFSDGEKIIDNALTNMLHREVIHSVKSDTDCAPPNKQEHLCHILNTQLSQNLPKYALHITVKLGT